MGLVIVTGGSRGLGYECAKEMRAAGHDVVLVAREKERLVAVAAPHLEHAQSGGA